MAVSTVDATVSLIETTVEHACETRRSSGGLMVSADPRGLETALVCHALAALKGNDAVIDAIGEALSRARQWLVAAETQCHVPIAKVIEQALRAIALGMEAGVDLTHGDNGEAGSTSMRDN